MGNQAMSKVDDWRTPEKLELLECWARDFTLTQVAEKIGIAPKTLVEWRKKYPDIEQAVSKGKELIDYRVENALLKVALGYTTTETKTIISPPDKNGNRSIRVEKTEKEVAPNPTAIMCWLNNRKPDQWKRNRDNVLQTKDDDSKITVNIIRHGKDDDKEEWNVSATSDNKKSSKKSNDKKASDETESWQEELTDEEREWLEE